MSSEPSDTAEADHNDSPPKAPKTSSKASTAADVLKALRDEERRMIRFILPEAKKHPEVYAKVIAKIKSSKIRDPRRWRESGFIRNFIGWLAMTNKDARPDLEDAIAVLAIFDCYSSNAPSKFRTSLVEHGLRVWATRKLKGERASTEQGSPETLRTSPKAPKVKQETILPSIEFDQIAPRASSTAAQGVKRPADDPPAEHPPKRTVSKAEHEALAAQVARIDEAVAARLPIISSRSFGTQTSPPPREAVMKLVSAITEQQGKHNQTLAEHSRALREQGRALVDFPSTVREVVRQEIQRTIVPVSNDTSIFQRSQAHGPSYTVIANQPMPSYAFDTAGEFQIVEAPQGRAAGSRFNSRFGMYDH
ncbi:uncharacterized protein NECHADRAFT_77477 [Fusarium vanettenii 77-13-4]|uniref:Uncharacterized protein n=1 Tax=Fusarium vanettenii (strain ATCC MYA-4622 / CBS 123669 / FGSC 9596 / NRRL 45880 / 77-13-4) TaxID=660122 RepID=C7YLC1_FUSV7|nr:uncharacterized protein NECHADRAFT_77477 [Fusarium vanettenii 77-13-4]EEU46761.1 hypothetical protein NECHADRAFT_77477 [Fusarium vanettenii 77-13-4]